MLEKMDRLFFILWLFIFFFINSSHAWDKYGLMPLNLDENEFQIFYLPGVIKHMGIIKIELQKQNNEDFYLLGQYGELPSFTSTPIQDGQYLIASGSNDSISWYFIARGLTKVQNSSFTVYVQETEYLVPNKPSNEINLKIGDLKIYQIPSKSDQNGILIVQTSAENGCFHLYASSNKIPSLKNPVSSFPAWFSSDESDDDTWYLILEAQKVTSKETLTISTRETILIRDDVPQQIPSLHQNEMILFSLISQCAMIVVNTSLDFNLSLSIGYDSFTNLKYIPQKSHQLTLYSDSDQSRWYILARAIHNTQITSNFTIFMIKTRYISLNQAISFDIDANEQKLYKIYSEDPLKVSMINYQISSPVVGSISSKLTISNSTLPSSSFLIADELKDPNTWWIYLFSKVEMKNISLQILSQPYEEIDFLNPEIVVSLKPHTKKLYKLEKNNFSGIIKVTSNDPNHLFVYCEAWDSQTWKNLLQNNGFFSSKKDDSAWWFLVSSENNPLQFQFSLSQIGFFL